MNTACPRLPCVYMEAKLTKRIADAAGSPTSGQIFFRDTELSGFALRITAGGAKSLSGRAKFVDAQDE